MSSDKKNSRIPNFYNMTIEERILALEEANLISNTEAQSLMSSSHTLTVNKANKLVENVVGVFGLPLGYAINFLINGKNYAVPLVIEEASVVAGLSGTAKIARNNGGFVATGSEPILIGQVQVIKCTDIQEAKLNLMSQKEKIIGFANSLEPNLVARGGGAFDIEVFSYQAPNTGEKMVVLHLLVNTQDAMGANLVNGMCEGVAPLIEELTQGIVLLKILSNLTDRAIAKARISIPVEHLSSKELDGKTVRDRIITANELAIVDPYRAATHNKGIMNGVDAIAIATGNDWRAIEAGVHAWAARDGKYRCITTWSKSDDGDLQGSIEIPLNVGTVGGTISNNPSVRINQQLLGSPNSVELTEIIASIGLAQNLAALKALATNGIQQNHMTLHARSIAASIGTPDHLFDKVIDKMIESAEIKPSKALEILGTISTNSKKGKEAHGEAKGKLILLGEHSVVYGRQAIGFPMEISTQTWIHQGGQGIRLQAPESSQPEIVHRKHENPLIKALYILLEELDLLTKPFLIKMNSDIPKGMGLGSSAAASVSILRGLNHYFKLQLTDKLINTYALSLEKIAHGNSSGIDNTIATFGFPMQYQNSSGKPKFMKLSIRKEIPLVIGLSHDRGLTLEAVRSVKKLYKNNPKRYEAIFDQIDELTVSAISSIKSGDLNELGELMNINHGYLNSLQLSTPSIEQLVDIARENGALGAKMTGGGKGGSVIVLCPKNQKKVSESLKLAGYQSITTTIPTQS